MKKQNENILLFSNITIFWLYFFDLLHLLIGLIILFLLINLLIYTHNHFSKNNKKIDIPSNQPNQLPNQLSQTILK